MHTPGVRTTPMPEAIEARNPQWANVIRLLTQYGLRPVELQHLSAKLDEAGS
ncbi:MAG: hypothetical protein ACKN89_16570 [Cyanobium sp.]